MLLISSFFQNLRRFSFLADRFKYPAATFRPDFCERPGREYDFPPGVCRKGARRLRAKASNLDDKDAFPENKRPANRTFPVPPRPNRETGPLPVRLGNQGEWDEGFPGLGAGGGEVPVQTVP
jgi:hypothetical protein